MLPFKKADSYTHFCIYENVVIKNREKGFNNRVRKCSSVLFFLHNTVYILYTTQRGKMRHVRVSTQ